jgi:hypothetical protein
VGALNGDLQNGKSTTLRYSREKWPSDSSIDSFKIGDVKSVSKSSWRSLLMNWVDVFRLPQFGGHLAWTQDDSKALLGARRY